MQFIGKILGFFLGYKLLGNSLIGGLIGVAVGHWADKKLYELGSVKSSVFTHKPLTRQALFMHTTFAVLGHLSKSKGQVTKDDIQLATNLMAQLKLDSAQQQQAQQAFTRGKAADFPLRQVMQEFREGCGQRSDLIRFFLEVQLQAAVYDGVLDRNEQQVLFVIAETLGLTRTQYERMLAMAMAAQHFRNGFQQRQSQGGYQQGSYQRQQESYQQQSYQQNSGPTLADAYTMLGVSENDDQTTVKRAYRKLMNEYHPDKLVSKGLPPEMMEVAKEKAQQIQAAYDLVCKAKGWK